MYKQFSLMLFSTDAAFVKEAVAAGVDTIIIDWENIGKKSRQTGFDTQINHDTLDDLRRIRSATQAKIICRLNAMGSDTAGEVEDAIEAGADELLLPMLRKAEEAEELLKMARDRCGVGILIETVDAVRNARSLGRLPLSRVYVGLNDLAIDRGLPHIFTSVADGMIDRIRDAFSVPFGFGGLTLPDLGYPIPCRLLIAEMARLACSFSFLRRSFLADVKGKELMIEVPGIHKAIANALKRDESAVYADHNEFCKFSRNLERFTEMTR